MNMVMEAFEQSNGFSALTADELFFVNGGSDNSGSMGNALSGITFGNAGNNSNFGSLSLGPGANLSFGPGLGFTMTATAGSLSMSGSMSYNPSNSSVSLGITAKISF
ncbi:MAG: hypothetical protein LBG43_11240 [Treponema sp.]|jgi:hypothetical protein|nr:hypothetical protein [Treponema sp.]